MAHITIGALPRPDYFVQSEIDRLRVNVGFAGADKKIIMVTSSEPNEGKSYISVNLWNELAKAGKNVCYVDADMRKSNLRTTLRLSTGSEEFLGLSHFLAGRAEVKDIIYSTDIDGAYIIPTVTLVNPSLLLEGKRFGNLLQSLRQSFDYVIVDTPPLEIVSDGQMIASKCDGCILVVRAHATGRGAVRGSLLHLQQVGCPLLGVVLNRLENKRIKGQYYKKGYYSKGYYTRAYYTDRRAIQDEADTGIFRRRGESDKTEQPRGEAQEETRTDAEV